MASKETLLDKPLGGLFLMTILTAVWTVFAEYYFDNFDYRIVGVIFGIVLIFFIYSYRKLARKNELLPVSEEIKGSRKENLYWIIFALEGVGILAANIILTNINKSELFISCFALVVGLHFIPLAKVFERKFDYYIGFWTILIAATGIFLILQNKFDYKLVNGFVCSGCAVSTALYGVKMIDSGNKISAKISVRD